MLRVYITFLVSLIFILPRYALCEVPANSNKQIYSELREVEAQGIELLKDNFPEDYSLKLIFETYDQEDDSDLKTSVFTAIIAYVDYTFKPKINDMKPAQSEALKKLDEVAKRHMELWAKLDS